MMLELEHWLREGRGKSFQFQATDEEIGELLPTVLPVEFSPYSLLGILTVKIGRVYQAQWQFTKLTDFLTLRQQGYWQFFLHSQPISGDLLIPEEVSLERLFATNGLVNLQHGRMTKGLLQPSQLGVVDKIHHTVTGELIEHRDYVRIFNTLKRAVAGRSARLRVAEDVGLRRKSRHRSTWSPAQALPTPPP